MKSKGILCAVLAALMLTACAQQTPDNSSDSVSAESTSVETQAPDALEARKLVEESLPGDLDYQGESFNTLMYEGFVMDMWIESETGDVVEDSIYARNRSVEERLNVKIEEPTVLEFMAASSTIQNTISSGDDTYDLYLSHMVQTGADSANKIFLNWYDIDYVNFDNPWYPAITIDRLTVNGKMFLTISDMMYSSLSTTYCMYYDRTKAVDYGITDIYDTVMCGEWTLDKLVGYYSDVYSDLNGNSKRDIDDYYGYSTSIDSNVVTFLWAFDDPVLEITDDLEINMLINNEKTSSIITRLRDFFYNTNGAFIADDYLAFIGKFQNGTALFIPRLIGDAVTYFREVENFGIIPFPKYDENQENYLTMLDGSTNVMAVPMTVSDTDLVGAVVEALSAYGWKNVVPAYYDIALKVKGTRDDESVSMLDMCVEGRCIDFAYVYDGWKGFAFTTSELLQKGSNKEFSSFYASREKQALKQYEKILSVFVD